MNSQQERFEARPVESTEPKEVNSTNKGICIFGIIVLIASIATILYNEQVLVDEELLIGTWVPREEVKAWVLEGWVKRYYVSTYDSWLMDHESDLHTTVYPYQQQGFIIALVGLSVAVIGLLSSRRNKN